MAFLIQWLTMSSLSVSHYLQHQGYGSPLSGNQGSAAVSQAARETPSSAGVDSALRISNMPLLINAVASEFNPAELKPSELNQLQSTLNRFGLISTRETRLFSEAREASQASQTETFDLMAFMNKKSESTSGSYSDQQATRRFTTLLNNLVSAAETISASAL